MTHTDSGRRLAILTATSGHSGVDRVVRNLAPAIAAAGIHVDVLRIRGHGPEMDPDTPGLHVVELPAAHTYSALPALVRYLRRARPHALLSDKDRVNRVALLGVCLARVPVRTVVRTGTTVSRNLAARGGFDRWLTRLSMRYLYRLAAAIVVPSDAAADDLAETIGIPRNRVTSVPSPVITSDLRERAARPPDRNLLPPGCGPLIVGVGELSQRKDYATLVRAFARLDAARGARLLILGEGRRRTELESLARRLGVSDRIRLPGFVDNPYPAIAAASVFVHASRFEGSPVVVMEAVGLGRPIVCTDCPSGPREILADGKYGRLVPVGDDAAMAAAIAAQLDEPPSPGHVREAAERYTVEASRDAYLRVLALVPGDD